MSSDQNLDESDILSANSGATPTVLGSPADARTFSIDGTSLVATSLTQTKITLVEHFPTENGLLAKPVVNLVIPNDQFIKIMDALEPIAARLRMEAGLGDS